MEILTHNEPSCKSFSRPAGSGTKGQTRVSRPFQIVSGLDCLEISLHLDIQDNSIFDKLSFYKKEVQTTFNSSVAFSFHSKEYFKWNLQRTGTKLYPYVLRCGDISLMLSSRDGESTIPNCKIEFGSISAHNGVFDIYKRLLQWLAVYGFTVRKDIVSRVDLAVDCVGLCITETHVSNPERWITRARKFSIYFQDWNLTGVMLGKGSIALRVYDKALELRNDSTKALFFYDLWNLPLSSASDTPVTRVEFQFRRDILKEFAIPVNTVKDLQKNLDTVFQYACTKWSRLSDSPVDRKNNNHQRSESSAFWKRVQSAVFNFPASPNQRIKKVLSKNLKSLRAQARGCLLNVAAASGHDPDDFFGIIATVQDVVSQDFSEFMTDRYSDFVKLFDVRLNECFVGF